MRRALLLPFTFRPWRDLRYLTLGLFSGIVAFGLLIIGPLAGTVLIITPLGVPMLLLGLWLCRWWSNVERRRAALAGLWVPVSRRRWNEGGILRRTLAAVRDPMTWRELAYLLLLSSVALACFVVGVTAWVAAFSVLVAPAWMWAIPGGVPFGLFTVDTPWDGIPLALTLGPIATVAAAWLIRGSASVQALMTSALLGGDLSRIEELTLSRAGAVDAAAVELRRIERDLHDGAQARLVSIAMDLGMARERLADDPEAAAALIARSHEDAKTALVELRDLARGIHPAILADRGLDAAVSALAARCSVPCRVAIDLPARLPPAVESAAYFTVAEALTNVAKHSGATRCDVAAAVRERRLIVEVRDDGRGDADTSAGTGIVGLRGRVEALDGRLRVTSPPGQGTTLRAELPCGS
jgi:signal transduction histidine kinase